MAKAEFWKTDLFFGIAVVISIIPFNRLSERISHLTRRACMPSAVATSHAPSGTTAVIAIAWRS